MGNLVAIMGESGSGKSTSIENLDPLKTAIINVANKDLPFKGWKKKYLPIKANEGNLFISHSAVSIINFIKHISSNRKDIKAVIIDDTQYIMAFEFMEKAKEKGFEKFTTLADNFFRVIQAAKESREDLTFVFLCHSEQTSDNRTKIKTIGKLLDEKITIEGLFTVVLKAFIEMDDKDIPNYYFLTMNDGMSTVKSPKGMFSSTKIPNDLNIVINCIEEYNN